MKSSGFEEMYIISCKRNSSPIYKYVFHSWNKYFLFSEYFFISIYFLFYEKYREIILSRVSKRISFHIFTDIVVQGYYFTPIIITHMSVINLFNNINFVFNSSLCDCDIFCTQNGVNFCRYTCDIRRINKFAYPKRARWQATR